MERVANPNGSPEGGSATSRPERDSASGKLMLNILVLDDSYADFDAIRRALNRIESIQVRVKRAKTLAEARLARASEHFDVAFVDYDLGVDSGARFLEEMGGRGSSTVPILATGLPDGNVQSVALKAGAIGIINKADLSPLLLETTIRTALYTRDVESKLHQLIASTSGDD